MRRLLWLLSAALLLSSVVSAQAVDSYSLRIYAVGATAPITTASLPSASVSCNQAAPPATATTRNPNKAVWDDPVNVGKVCVYTDTVGGPLLATPTGFASLEATVAIKSGTLESDESNRAPFSRTPAPPMNARLVR